MNRVCHLIVCLVVFIFLGCEDENSRIIEEKPIIDLIDPADVVNNIQIDGSTIVQGNAPQPSNTNTSPSIEELENIEVVAGNKYGLTISQKTSKEANGIFLQIKEADRYFDIPASAFTSGGRRDFNLINGKQLSHNDISIEIEISGNMEKGTFFVLCSLYDINNEVSNVIEFSIQVVDN